MEAKNILPFLYKRANLASDFSSSHLVTVLCVMCTNKNKKQKTPSCEFKTSTTMEKPGICFRVQYMNYELAHSKHPDSGVFDLKG